MTKTTTETTTETVKADTAAVASANAVLAEAVLQLLQHIDREYENLLPTRLNKTLQDAVRSITKPLK